MFLNFFQLCSGILQQKQTHEIIYTVSTGMPAPFINTEYDGLHVKSPYLIQQIKDTSGITLLLVCPSILSTFQTFGIRSIQ